MVLHIYGNVHFDDKFKIPLTFCTCMILYSLSIPELNYRLQTVTGTLSSKLFGS